MDSYKCSSQSLLNFYEEDRFIMEVIEEIEKELHVQNKVVCQFLIDGSPLTSQEEATWAERKLSQVSHIEYQVADLTTLVKEVAEGWIDAIDEQKEPIYALANEMVTAPSSKTYMRLERVFRWCHEFVESLETLKMNRSASSRMQMIDWDVLESRLSGTVRELLTKSEKKDFKAVGYTLEYDLVEILQAWSQELEKLIAQIQRDQRNDQGKDGGASATNFFMPSVGRTPSFN